MKKTLILLTIILTIGCTKEHTNPVEEAGKMGDKACEGYHLPRARPDCRNGSCCHLN